MGFEGRELAVKLRDCCRDQASLREIARIRDKKSGFEIVGSVGNDVVARNQIEHIFSLDLNRVGNKLGFGIDAVNRIGGGVGLHPADIAGAVGDLALKVGKTYRIEVRYPDRSNAGSCKIENKGAAQPARTHNQDPGLLCLSGAAHLAQDDVARIALQLLVFQMHVFSYHARPSI